MQKSPIFTPRSISIVLSDLSVASKKYWNSIYRSMKMITPNSLVPTPPQTYRCAVIAQSKQFPQLIHLFASVTACSAV